MFGFLNVYKPKGKTSHDVVAVLRRVTKIKQIGHTGTLDPFAEGVLPICIGKATRLIEYLEDEKAYIGTVQLGKATATYDTEGEITKISDKKIGLNELKQALNNFTGEIEQIPPIYSALKVNGKKLYEYARAGEEVEIKSRKVTIHRLEILKFDEKNQTVELFIDCSKGTYIRSIANDLGEKLGTFGFLVKLERVKAGRFLVENSIKLENLDTVEKIIESLINPLEYLNLPKYILNKNELERISHGMNINIEMPDGFVILTYNDIISAICEVKNHIAKTKKVFL